MASYKQEYEKLLEQYNDLRTNRHILKEKMTHMSMTIDDLTGDLQAKQKELDLYKAKAEETINAQSHFITTLQGERDAYHIFLTIIDRLVK